MKKSKFPKSNREIKSEKVRLVNTEGEMIGVVSLNKAMQMAAEVNLDLVEISPNAEPPVCKILDFSRFKYDAKKKQQESKKKQKKTSLKEMKFKVNIGQGDLDVKLNKIRKFLEEGDKVKISLWFKGREIIHRDKGKELFDKILASLDNMAKIESEPKMEGKQILMVLSPNVAA
jgi:translation initiation factor IF-3